MNRNSLRSGWLRAACALALACGLALPLAAQTDVTTSRISGTVTDSNGAALPGVTVEAKNTETGLVRNELTDSAGFFNLLNLPTGTYDVSATLDGYATATASAVRILLGTSPSVNFTLPQAQVSEAITVTAEQLPVVEVTNTSASTTIQVEQIKNQPINGRDFKSLVLLTPESRLDSERGNLSISGQRGIATNVTVDGVDYNDPFFGGAAGGAEGRAPLSISQESIKEFTVITNGASVEFGRSGGGFVNVITKTGTNALHGSAFYYNQPQSLISDFANGVKPADQKKEQYGASIGGPIIKDKLFYFASYDKQKRDLTVPINANVLDADIFARYPVLASPPTYVQTQDGSVLFGRFDFQATENQHFLLRYNNAKYDGLNGTSNASTRTESYNGVEGMNNKTFVASWSSVWGSNLLNDLNLNSVKEETPRADKGLGLPEIQLGSNRYGEVSFLPITATTKRKAFGDTVSYSMDKHVFKAGGEYNDTSIDQVFKGNWRGVFIFNNKADLLAGNWSQYRQFGGLNGLTADEAGKASFHQKETALFLQDQWFASSKLTFSFGLRLESQDNPNAPVLNANDRNPNGSFKLNAKIPDAKLTDQLSPRLGVSWSPDSKTAVRFAAGRYWSRLPGILLAQLYTSNGLRGTQYIANPGDPLAPFRGAAFNPSGVERIDFTKIPTPTGLGVFTIDPNFENSYTDRYTLGAEREVFPLVAVGADLTYAKGNQLQRLTDSNRQYDGTTASNGLPRYSSTRPDPFYGRITTSVSDARSKYQALSVSVTRRYANSWSLFSQVTYSKDKDNDSNERNFAGIQAEDYNNLDLNYGYSARDQRWKGVLSGVWDTPWWGIGLSGSYKYSTGQAYNATVNSDLNNDGESTTDRPTIGGVHFARNAFRQPSFSSLDFRASKSFGIGPGKLEVFAECFNCLNAANRSTSNTVWGTGQTANSNFGVLNQVTQTPRTIQLAVRYDF